MFSPPKHSRNIFHLMSFILVWRKRIKHFLQVTLDCKADILVAAEILPSIPKIQLLVINKTLIGVYLSNSLSIIQFL